MSARLEPGQRARVPINGAGPSGELRSRFLVLPPSTSPSSGLVAPPIDRVPSHTGVRLVPTRRAARLADPIHDTAEERWQREPVPLLQSGRRTRERRLPSQTGDRGEFVDEVRMEIPADRDHAIGAPGVLLVDPRDDVVEPLVDVPADLGRAARWVPRPRQHRDPTALVLGLIRRRRGETQLVEHPRDDAGGSGNGAAIRPVAVTDVPPLPLLALRPAPGAAPSRGDRRCIGTVSRRTAGRSRRQPRRDAPEVA